MLIQHAGTLKSDNLAVLGSNGGTMSLYNGDETYGFYLAGNDIPQPTASHTNTGESLSNCTLVWEKRKTSDSPSQEVWLLALKDCNATGGSHESETDKYQWKVTGLETWTDANASFFCSLPCWINGSSDPFATNIPETLPADTFGNAPCSERLLGTTCRHPGGPYAGSNTIYCITYTCSTK